MEHNTKARGSNMRMAGKSGMGSKLLTLISPMWAGEQKTVQTLSKPSLGLAAVEAPKKSSSEMMFVGGHQEPISSCTKLGRPCELITPRAAIEQPACGEASKSSYRLVIH